MSAAEFYLVDLDDFRIKPLRTAIRTRDFATWSSGIRRPPRPQPGHDIIAKAMSPRVMSVNYLVNFCQFKKNRNDRSWNDYSGRVCHSVHGLKAGHGIERSAGAPGQATDPGRLGRSSRFKCPLSGSIERGHVAASVTVLGRLAQALRIDPCELIRTSRR